MRRNITPEEIGEMHDRNENFNGRQANFDKIRLYHEVKSDLTAFLELCEDAQLVDGFAPNAHEKHAILWLDFSPVAMLDAEETTALTVILAKVDGVVLSAVDGHVRISFEINDIWND